VRGVANGVVITSGESRGSHIPGSVVGRAKRVVTIVWRMWVSSESEDGVRVWR
jgi:hypothetical protein